MQQFQNLHWRTALLWGVECDDEVLSQWQFFVVATERSVLQLPIAWIKVWYAGLFYGAYGDLAVAAALVWDELAASAGLSQGPCVHDDDGGDGGSL